MPIRSGSIYNSLTASLELCLLAFVVFLLIAGILAQINARFKSSPFDLIGRGLKIFLSSIPVFFLAILASFLFSLHLEYFPHLGRLSYSTLYERLTGFVLIDALLRLDFQLFVDGLWHLALPALVLSSGAWSFQWRRVSVFNALLVILGNLILVEYVFGWPGLSHWLLERIAC